VIELWLYIYVLYCSIILFCDNYCLVGEFWGRVVSWVLLGSTQIVFSSAPKNIDDSAKDNHVQLGKGEKEKRKNKNHRNIVRLEMLPSI
jgi:hypothetical protein